MFFDPVHANNQLHHRDHSNGSGYFGGGSPAPGTGVSQLYNEAEGRMMWEKRKGGTKKKNNEKEEILVWEVENPKMEKIKTKGKWLRGRCGLCDSFVNNCYHRYFCGFCGARLKWEGEQ